MKKAIHLLVVSLMLMAVTASADPTILNPSFQSNFITSGVGYGNIDGWTFIGPTPSSSNTSGLNPAGSQSPFADNGFIPDGSQVAFLQGNSSTVSLATTVTGLTAGTTYRVNFRANSRIASAPDGEGAFLGVFIDGSQMPVSLDYTAPQPVFLRIRPVGAGQQYHYVSFLFTATDADAALRIDCIADGGDRTLLIDAFTIAEEGRITTSRWTNDASSGISSDKTLWAYQFGSEASPVIDGITVQGVLAPGANNQIVTSHFTLAGPNTRTSDLNELTAPTADSGTSAIAANFVYGGYISQFALKDLTVGRSYVLSLLTVGWNLDVSPLNRLINVSSGSDVRLISQSQFGSDRGLRIDVPFTATTSTHVVSMQTAQTVSMHIYGVALNLSQPLFQVTTSSDSGPGSLREALTLAGSEAEGGIIQFHPDLDGQTIALTGGQLEVPATFGISIDASSLADGLTLDAGGNSRVMEIQAGANVVLEGLALTGGVGSTGGGAILITDADVELDHCRIHDNAGFNGGGIYVQSFERSASLVLNACSLYGNSATSLGGAIGGSGYSRDSLSMVLNATTIYGNSGKFGGGIACTADFVDVALSLNDCTISGNTGVEGGGISFLLGGDDDGLSLTRCTIYGNSATNGGGISIFAPLVLQDTIVAGNFATGGPDLRGASSTSVFGSNILSSLEGQSGVTPTTTGLIVANPRLSPLGDFGGPTPTMLPLPGSPAIDAATDSTTITDQRGFPRPVGAARDIGATEAPDWASLTTTDLALLWPNDLDGDGSPYGIEIAIGTDPFTPFGNSEFGFRASGRARLTFGNNPSAPFGTILRIMRSTTLDDGTFVEIGRLVNGGAIEFSENGDGYKISNGTMWTITDNDENGRPTPATQAFYRLQSDFSPPSPP